MRKHNERGDSDIIIVEIECCCRHAKLGGVQQIIGDDIKWF
jgi:hypothetical protein